MHFLQTELNTLLSMTEEIEVQDVYGLLAAISSFFLTALPTGTEQLGLGDKAQRALVLS
jgi:hypothetical protein